MTQFWDRWMRSGSRSGQTMIEFMLSAALLLLLVFGIMEMALVVFTYNSISNAAREASRYAIAAGPNSPAPASTSQIQAFAMKCAPSLKLSASDVNVSWITDPNLSSRQDAKITVSHTYPVSVPFLPKVNLKLSSTSQMMASQ
jgi:Flp pilus assembly protein TadG